LQQDPSTTLVSVLLLTDRGRDWLNPPEWIDRLHPQLVLLNVAAGDWDGFPPSQIIDALKCYSLLRTDVNGWIHISTEGAQMCVEVERSERKFRNEIPLLGIRTNQAD
jgi:beta-lactamase superfamily II metal-dependent hydrolase